ncbi:MAG: class I SAM-dependent methyltransferase [Actinomycetales bacterium]
MNASTDGFDLALASVRRRHRLRQESLWLVSSDGTRRKAPYRAWCRTAISGDETMLSRCSGPTLDVGCGPGRLVAALTRRGIPALGIDISDESLRHTRGRGALALRRDVFSTLPGEGRWNTVLLADGNVGIGGDPVHLLRRCASLLGRGGQVLVELAGPRQDTWRGAARWECRRSHSEWFPWAVLSVTDLAEVAALTGMTTHLTRASSKRWFASLQPQPDPVR